jgi:hypothetical protein
MVLAAAVLSACSGNPLPTGDGGGGGGGGGDDSVVVPEDLRGNIEQVIYVPASGTRPPSLRIRIRGLDTTPLLATWEVYPALDVPGYTAFKIQEDPLDRMFVGLAAVSGNGAVTGVLAADGGQFNTQTGGAVFSRTGGFTPPSATGSGPATGQVSYAGDYVGMLNVGLRDGPDLLPPPPGTDPSTLPGQPVRVTGKAFLNANFSDNTVGGAVFNRVAVDAGVDLQSIILVQNVITENGTFAGTVEPIDERQGIGSYAGVFGGPQAGGVAGAVTLSRVNNLEGDAFQNVTERGIFVLNQCGLAGLPSAPECAGTAP